MDQDEPQSFSSGHNHGRNPRPVTINPDSRACETSSPGTRSETPHPGTQEAPDGFPSSSPKRRIPADRDRARGRDEASARHFPDRIAEVRRDHFGDEGVPAIADALQLPHRTWMNYEKGVVMPATVLLCFINLTLVESHWLLTGRGPKYQGPAHSPGRG